MLHLKGTSICVTELLEHVTNKGDTDIWWNKLALSLKVLAWRRQVKGKKKERKSEKEDGR